MNAQNLWYFPFLISHGSWEYPQTWCPRTPPLPPSSGYVTFVVEIFHECFDLIKQLWNSSILIRYAIVNLALSTFLLLDFNFIKKVSLVLSRKFLYFLLEIFTSFYQESFTSFYQESFTSYNQRYVFLIFLLELGL